MDNEGLTQYTRIAISLAERIASGQLKEGDKLSGRSKLSPEYNVSPETIRRTLRLLADMKVVEVKEQSGVYVLSADNARRYLHNFADQTDIRGKQQQLKELLVRQEHLNRQMAALCRDILDETSQTPDALPNYYCRIPDDWPHSGTTVGALRFWQATGATIVAIRRGLSYIVSPGPYAELYAGDAVIFVGGVKAREAVSHFFANP
jgi:K+/H+ antiporter YhaU regulatory subunit KhtT|uniref:GntR family transcriptional regulator n=1 Tax=Angelakisella sp. TaxID=1935177 RepID=UPI004028E751